ncbi:hypothetical protein AVEN_219649-1, partial [Araneus ventricosus]
PLKQGLFGRKRLELGSPNLGGHLSPYLTPCYNLSLRRTEMGCGLARIIRPPTLLISQAISEPPLPSKEDNHLRLAFEAVKRKFLNRLARCERVKFVLLTLEPILTYCSSSWKFRSWSYTCNYTNQRSLSVIKSP